MSMANSSMIRRVDSLGRIVIPMQLRRKLNIEEKDTLEIMYDKSLVFIKKSKPTCIFCGNGNEIVPFKGRHVCLDCVSDAK